MLQATLLLFSCLADREPVRTIAHGAFTVGSVNMSILCPVGAILSLRRRNLFGG